MIFIQFKSAENHNQHVLVRSDAIVSFRNCTGVGEIAEKTALVVRLASGQCELVVGQWPEFSSFFADICRRVAAGDYAGDMGTVEFPFEPIVTKKRK